MGAGWQLPSFFCCEAYLRKRLTCRCMTIAAVMRVSCTACSVRVRVRVGVRVRVRVRVRVMVRDRVLPVTVYEGVGPGHDQCILAVL